MSFQQNSIQVKVNGFTVEVPPGATVFQACESANIYVPSICNHPDLPAAGKCGVCIVKINGVNYSLSCSTKCKNGMIIETASPDVKSKAFQALTNFNDMPLMPSSKEIEDIWKYFTQKVPVRGRHAEKTNAVSFDPKLCVNCGRCARACADIQAIGALDEDSHSLNENECIQCGMCTTVCPTGALTERLSISSVVKALAFGKTLVLQVAPAVRVSIGECFGDPTGTVVTGKIIKAAREMGFRYVFDTSFGADLTVVEEATEFLTRINEGGVLPMFSSCCPAWINFVEKIHPELIANLSSSKSPQAMVGRIIKTYFAERKNLDPSSIFVVSLMPCTAKKDEIQREQLKGDVDAVLTSREFEKLLSEFEISWASIGSSNFDSLLGDSSGSGQLFGVSGGVAESVLRFIHEEVTKKPLGKVEFTQWRGNKGIKTATAIVGERELKIAVCNGISFAREFIETHQFSAFQFIEVMACPQGCIAGGGQPKLRHKEEALQRASALYEIDHQKTSKRTPKDNPEISELYTSYLGKPNEGLAAQLLHTHYQQQNTPFLEMKRKMGTMPVVAYGSTSGSASRFARILASFIGTSPIMLNVCGIQAIAKKGAAIIFCSTCGDGEFPSNAEKFVAQLQNSTDDLSNVRFAVCALGSKTYPKYCVAGHTIDKLLVQHQAKRLLPIVELDSSSIDKGEGVFEAWAPQVVMALGLKMPKISVTANYSFTFSRNDEDTIHTNPEKPIGFEYGVMLSSTVLTPQGFEPQMHRYQVKLPNGMTYEAGDHVAILPQNEPETVRVVLAELQLEPNEIITVESLLPEGYNTIPRRVTIRQLFSQYLDLNGIPTRSLLRAYQQYSKDQFCRERLERILDPSEPRYYNDLVNDSSVGEFILEFSRHGYPPLDVLVTACPHIRPRLYCIASAPSETSRSIDLFVSDNIFGPGNTRRGLSTSFLRRFGITKLAIRTQKGRFTYPKDQTAPIIMAALDCGIAPMLSLLQHRESLTGEVGKASLFYGCRSKNTYPILESILQNYVEMGALQDFYVSYSREGTTKTYITDLMLSNADIVWSYWSNPKTSFYYCGPSRGIPDQFGEILVQITMKNGKMTREQAEKFCSVHTRRIESF